ncbi:hypothetical protein [Pseudovibrio sp. SCP19]
MVHITIGDGQVAAEQEVTDAALFMKMNLRNIGMDADALPYILNYLN